MSLLWGTVHLLLVLLLYWHLDVYLWHAKAVLINMYIYTGILKKKQKTEDVLVHTFPKCDLQPYRRVCRHRCPPSALYMPRGTVCLSVLVLETEMVWQSWLVITVCTVSKGSATVWASIYPSISEPSTAPHSLCIWKREAEALQYDGGVYWPSKAMRMEY